MTWFEIRPQDVWLFRDGKPFSAGEDHSAHSMFPPTPLTVQGALRQKISMSLGVSLAQYKKPNTSQARQAVEYIGPYGVTLDTGLFKMTGPSVSLRTKTGIEPLFAAPADLLRYEPPTEESECLDQEFLGDFFITGPDCNLTCDLESGYDVPYSVQNYENMPDYWVTAGVLADYLAGYAPDQSVFLPKKADKKEYPDAATAYDEGKRIWHKNRVCLSEGRFGVDIDAATSSGREGLLFQVEFIRPHDGIGLLVWVDDEKIPDVATLIEGEMTLGGEQRQANAYPVPPANFPALPAQVSGRFKVVFLTPAYFNAGWQPTENGDWSRVFGVPQDTISMVSAALYRPLHIGGWNGAANRPRTMHNYVASGSVYYFETTEAFDPPPTLTENPDEINHAAYLGFGQYAIGIWS